MVEHEPVHIYIHVPFCDGRCSYCSFYSLPCDAATAEAYITALAREIEIRMPDPVPTVQSLYVGGGTPTALSDRALQAFLEALRSRLVLTSHAEWTVETNPHTLTEQKAGMLRDAGVTRISIGAQTFHNPTLRVIGRRHVSEDTRTAVRLLRRITSASVGIDLIAGLPGVGHRRWAHDLESCLALDPDHVSVYALSVESRSRLAAEISTGASRPPSPAKLHMALHIAGERLSASGYRHYEVSNYARNDRLCLHNLSFWRGGDYWGFGPSAVTRLGRTRRTNAPDLKAYTYAIGQGQKPPAHEEQLTPAMDVWERIAFGIRLDEGAAVESLLDRHLDGAEELRQRWTTALKTLQTDGMVTRRGQSLVLTARGYQVADSVAESLPME